MRKTEPYDEKKPEAPKEDEQNQPDSKEPPSLIIDTTDQHESIDVRIAPAARELFLRQEDDRCNRA